jgi:hypothetical protein
MQKILSLVLIVLLVTIIGCSKKSDNPTSPNDGAAPTIPTVTFKGPSSSEFHAQTANSDAQLMTSLMSSSSIFVALPATKNGNVSTWTFTAGTLTQTFTSTKQSDGSYTWSWVVNGTDGSHTYNNWTYWSGTTSADGNTASWSFYDYNSTHSVEDLNYTNVNGVLTGTWLIYNTSGALASKMVIINKPDNSGEFDQYLDGTHLSMKVTWIASGTGNWWEYNSSGTSTNSGTF